MNYAFLLLAGSLLASTATAQTQKGQSITSGSVGVAYTHGTSTGFGTYETFRINSYSTSVNVALNRGVFVRDNWLVGYTLGFGRTWSGTLVENNQRDENQGAFRTTTGSLGGFVRRYWPVADRLFVYAGGGLGVSYGRTRGEYQSVLTPGGQTVMGTNTQENWSVDPSVQAGLLYAVSNRFGIDAGIRSNGLPIGASMASIGVNILSGRGGGAQEEAVTAPQTQAGRWLLGVSFGALGNTTQQTGTNPGDTRSTSGNIGVSAGRFVRDNTVVGLALNVTRATSTNNLSTASDITTYAIAPFVRVYKGQTRLRPFVEGSVNVSNTIQPVNRGYDLLQVGAQGSAGIAYMLGQRFIVQSTLATLYGRYQWYPKQTSDIKTTAYSVGLTGSIGSNLSVAYSF